MAYEVWLGTMLFPIPPSKIETKIKGQNKTLTLINGEEINILKAQGLSEISFDVLLPNVKYPFAQYEKRWAFNNAKYYLDQLEKYKVEKKPIWFKVIRVLPNDKALFDSNVKVSLEDYTIKEDRKEGFDFVVSIKLKQYKEFGTKIHDGTFQTQNRSTENSPSAKTTTYTVQDGDSLWSIAKYFYGDGSKHYVIYDANKKVIGGNPSLIKTGQVLTIPGVDSNAYKNAKPIQSTGTSEDTNSSETPISKLPQDENIVQITLVNELGENLKKIPDCCPNGTVELWYCLKGKINVKKLKLRMFGITVDADKGSPMIVKVIPDYHKSHNYESGISPVTKIVGSTVFDVTVGNKVGEKTAKAFVNLKMHVKVLWDVSITNYTIRGPSDDLLVN